MTTETTPVLEPTAEPEPKFPPRVTNKRLANESYEYLAEWAKSITNPRQIMRLREELDRRDMEAKASESAPTKKTPEPNTEPDPKPAGTWEPHVPNTPEASAAITALADRVKENNIDRHKEQTLMAVRVGEIDQRVTRLEQILNDLKAVFQ